MPSSVCRWPSAGARITIHRAAHGPRGRYWSGRSLHTTNWVLHGVALRVEGRLAAFSFGSYFGRDGHMFCVHAEKADTSFEGVYAVVCNELAKSLDPKCDIVDREEDMGIAGLRRSKSSWQPLDIVDKYTAVRLDGEQIGIRHLWESVFGDSRRDVDSFLVRYYSPERSVVRYHGDRVTAMAHIVPLTTQAGRTAYIYAVATDPAFRGRGLARSVVDECIARARRAGFDSVALIPAEESLKGFYAAAGFRRHGHADDLFGRLRFRYGRSRPRPCDVP